MAIWIEGEKCKACGKCVKACPYGAIEMDGEIAKILERCTLCGACVTSCTFGAICTDAVEKEIPDLSRYRGVWVLAEHREGVLHRATFELLGCGAALAQELEQELSVLLLGYKVNHLAKELIAYGAQKVYLAEHRNLAHYCTTAYAKVVAELVRGHEPNILLLSATPTGRDLAPRLARHLELGLTADCTTLSTDRDDKNHNLLQTRPAFGGNVMATIVTPRSRPQLATVRPGIMEPLAPDYQRKGQVISHKTSITKKDLSTTIIEMVRSGRKAVDLSQAKTIVAGGRGVGDAAGFDLLRELAEAMGGEVGGSRVAVEAGWITQDRQIGQTGQTVKPDIYIACGISGAIQHRAGILGAKNIIAINKEADAPIMLLADYAIVGDLFEVVPLLIKTLKKEAA